jgi:phospholipid/cholesterol/gamma-HCH transport system permease protein
VGGFLGGLVVADAALNIDYFAYYHTTLQFAYLEDIFGGLTKTIFFGTIIAMTGCFYGFNTEGGAAGVGRATTSSVVVTLVLILISDYILTTVLLWITGMK